MIDAYDPHAWSHMPSEWLAGRARSWGFMGTTNIIIAVVEFAFVAGAIRISGWWALFFLFVALHSWIAIDCFRLRSARLQALALQAAQ